jgi:hypothetical protein
MSSRHGPKQAHHVPFAHLECMLLLLDRLLSEFERQIRSSIFADHLKIGRAEVCDVQVEYRWQKNLASKRLPIACKPHEYRSGEGLHTRSFCQAQYTHVSRTLALPIFR